MVDQDRVNQVLSDNGFDMGLSNPDLVVVIVNELLRGGSGSPGIAVGSNFPRTSPNQPLWPRVTIHELGHSFANLGDEYDSTENPNPALEDVVLNQALCEGNRNEHLSDPTFLDRYGKIGAEADRSTVPWRHWFSPNSDEPAPDIDDPGNGSNTTLMPLLGRLGCPDYFAKPSTHSTMRFEDEPFGNVNIELLLRKIHWLLYYPDDVKVRNATRQVFAQTSLNLTDT